MRRVIPIALLLAATVLTGCTALTGTRTAPTPQPIDDAGTPAPGVTRLSEETSQTEVVGTVVFRRDDGGYFAVADLVPGGEVAPDARILAVLVHGDGSLRGEDVASLVGSYCRFVGSTVETSATDYGAPLLDFDTYHILSVPETDDAEDDADDPVLEEPDAGE